jgi:UDP-3-O-[3-hydroxymyristoyl] glucosamine N-acyltransferase
MMRAIPLFGPFVVGQRWLRPLPRLVASRPAILAARPAAQPALASRARSSIASIRPAAAPAAEEPSWADGAVGLGTDAPLIHPSAVVHDGARLGAGVVVGPYCIVGADVTLAERVRLHSHVVLSGHTSIGEACRSGPRRLRC